MASFISLKGKYFASLLSILLLILFACICYYHTRPVPNPPPPPPPLRKEGIPEMKTLYIMQDDRFVESWDRLQDEGILEGRLINHVWREFPAERRTRLVEIMKQFDMICEAPLTPCEKEKERDRVGIGNRDYYVPSMFSPTDVKQVDDMPSRTMYVDFQEFFTSKEPVLLIFPHVIYVIQIISTNDQIPDLSVHSTHN